MLPDIEKYDVIVTPRVRYCTPESELVLPSSDEFEDLLE